MASSMNISGRAAAILGRSLRSQESGALGAIESIDLSIGQPDSWVPLPMKQQVIQAIEQNQSRYTPAGGVAWVRDRLAQEILRRWPGWGSYKQDFDVFVTSGVTAGLFTAMLACADRGDGIIVPDPGFAVYADLATLGGLQISYADTYPDFILTAERIGRCISPRTRIVVLNNPSNPTGVLMPKAELERIALLCEEHGIWLISDEIYGELTPAGRFHSVAEFSQQSIVLNGFSKSHAAAGWRIGCAAGPVPIIEAMERLHGKIYVNAPSLTQAAIPAALDIDCQAVNDLYTERRTAFSEAMDKTLNISDAQGGIFCFCRLPDDFPYSASEFCKAAQIDGVMVLPGRLFSLQDTCFRVSLCQDAALLKEAARRLTNTMERLARAVVQA